MPRWFTPVAIVCGAMLAISPVVIASADYESTMGLVQKIFYYHAPVGMVMFLSTFVCGFASLAYLRKGRASSDRLAEAAAELTVVLGAIVLLTGPLWARKAWGVWWQWEPRLTSTLVLWLLYVAYMLLRRFGGPGTEKLAAGVALFHFANAPMLPLLTQKLALAHADVPQPAAARVTGARPPLVEHLDLDPR